jgi:hypothetical protein
MSQFVTSFKSSRVFVIFCLTAKKHTKPITAFLVEMFPVPTKTTRNGEELYFSKIENGPIVSLSARDAKSLSTIGGKLVIPTTFIARCREFVMTHISYIQKWFNPSPTLDTLERIIQFTNSVSYSPNELCDIQIQMDGLILENSRILPNYTILKTKSAIIPDLTKGLVHPQNKPPELDEMDELEEVDISVPIGQDNEPLSGDDDDDDDESDYEDEERFRIIQQSLDNAREELERLRKRKTQRRS